MRMHTNFYKLLPMRCGTKYYIGNFLEGNVISYFKGVSIAQEIIFESKSALKFKGKM